MTGSGAKINRQLKERLPCPEQLPQRLLVSRTSTRATLRPISRREAARRRASSLPRQCDQVVANPARQMHRLAAHPDFAVDDRDRRRARIDHSPDAMRHAQHRHDRAFGKRHRPRQGIEAGGDPSALRGEKAQALVCRDTAGQDQFELFARPRRSAARSAAPAG